MLKIFYCSGISMKTNQIRFFGTYNGNIKYNFIWVVFNRNLSLKHHVVRIPFSCNEMFFKTVFFKRKKVLWLFLLTFNFKYWLFCFIFILLRCVCFSNNSPFNFNNLRKQPIFKTNLLNWFFLIYRNKMRNIELLFLF